MSDVFVGRADELRALAATVEDAGDVPAVAIVVGDPGSGKTRLVREAATHVAVPRRYDIAGYEPERGVPLAAAAPLLRSLGRSDTTLYTLLSEEAARLEPVQVFEATLRAFLSGERTLLVVDDVHWLDELSLALCHYLVRGADAAGQPLALLASSRPSEQAAELVGSLTAVLGDARVTQLELGPLDDAAATELLLALAPGLEPAALEQRRTRAAGSPFWLEALARSDDSGSDARRLLVSRLRGTGADATAMLALLVVAARPISTDEAARVLRWPTARADAASTELVARAVAVRRGALLSPAHDLIREAAAEQLPERERVALHRQVAADLEANAGGDLRLLREALEHRLAAALPATGLAEQLVASPQRTLLGIDGLRTLTSIFESDPASASLGLPLTRLALDLAAFEDAARLGSMAARRLTGTDRADALLAAAHGAFEAHDGERTRELVSAARAGTGTDAIAELEADALDAMTCLWIEGRQEEGQRLARAAALRARELIEAADGHASLTPRERRACAAAVDAAVGAAMQADQADELLRLVDEEEALTEALDVSIVFHRTYGLRHSGRYREAADFARHAWRAANARVLPHVALEAGVVLGQTLHDLGELEEAEQLVDEVAPLGERLRMTSYRTPPVARLRGELETLRGDWRAALALLVANVERTTDPHYRIGEHEVIAMLLARVRGPAEQHEVVRRVELAAEDSARAGCPRCAAQLRFATAYALAKVGLLEDARREFAVRQTTGRTGLSVYQRLRAAAAIAAAAGGPAALRAAAEARREAERLELRVEAVWQRLDEAELMEGDAAVAALRAAGELAEEIGSRTQAELARRGLRARGVRTWTRRPSTAAALTHREAEVASLVAGGASNREIATQLFLSPKTVERHVSNALRKLGARNRAELAARVAALEHAGFAR